MVGASIDEAADPAFHGCLEGVDNGVHVGTEEVGPSLLCRGVGRQVDDSIDALELLDPLGAPDTQVGFSDGGIAARIAVEQAQLVAALKVTSDLGTEVAGGAGDEHGSDRTVVGHCVVPLLGLLYPQTLI